MENIVFLLGTEYALITTLGIIKEYFSHDYNITIIRISNVEKKRLNNISIDSLGIRYHELVYDYFNPTRELKKELQFIIDLKPNKFFFFVENKFWMNYLFSRLHRLKTTIILGPDGMKTYDNKVYWTLRQRIRMFIDGLKYTYKSGLLPILPHIEKTYATSKYIDEVWVEYPKHYNNITRKKVVEFHYTVDKRFMDLLIKVFNAKNSDFEIIKNEPVIFYIDSSCHNRKYYNRTINILNQIKEKYPNRKLLIKYHPISVKDAKEHYSIIQDNYEVNSSYPAELYLASAKDALVVSMVSTSELFYNPNCKYYWIYKMYSDMYNYDTIKNPTDYIHIIDSINQIGED